MNQIVRLANVEERRRAARVFGGWPEAIIWSCLEGVMGAVYGDNRENPQSVMAVLGDFCFFAGQPKRELALMGGAEPKLLERRNEVNSLLAEGMPADWGREFAIMVPQNPSWAELLEECYGEQARKITRYAIKKEAGVFNLLQLQRAVRSLPPEYQLKIIDQEYFSLCRSEAWSRDLVAQFTDYEQFMHLGLGIVAVNGGHVVSGASTYARYRSGIEIEIDTCAGYRRKGLAYACGARLIIECLRRGLYPSWDAHNPASVALAKKLGYHAGAPYPAYEVMSYHKWRN